MAWVYLDDQFPDHPKVVAAGGDAAWLFVCGLAYCKRYNTAGAIPASQVGKLSDRKSARKLAEKLVEVGLWESTPTGFAVHDYSEWNRPAESRSEAGRKGAAARWGHSDRNGNANGNRNAVASVSHMAQDAQSLTPSLSLEAAASVTGTNEGSAASPAAALHDVVKEAFGIIIARRLNANPPANPAAYTAHLWKALPVDHADQLARLDVGAFTPEELALLLEPVPKARVDLNGVTTTADGVTFAPGSGRLENWSQTR